MFTHRASKSASAYQQVSVETSVGQASPHNLVEMLFDGLLVAVGAARAAMQRVTSRPSASRSSLRCASWKRA
jgi:flagellar protein FliS